MKRLLILVALLTTACEPFQPPALPSPVVDPAASTVPTRIILNASSRTDQQLDVTAQVQSADGHGVPNVQVQFSIGAGTITPVLTKTDNTGMAKTLAASTASTTISAWISDTLRTSISVLGSTPELSASLVIPSATVGAASAMTARVIGSPLGGPFTYGWTFGDGGMDTTSTASVSHLYAQIGGYNVSVRITDGSGRTATASGIATVSPLPPPPEPPPAPAATLAVTVTCTPAAHGNATPCNVNASYGGTQLAATAITRVDWDWGDGATTPNGGVVSTHPYANAGSYLVFATVTATTMDGSKTATGSKAITVN